jgi:hypothetical protein
MQESAGMKKLLLGLALLVGMWGGTTFAQQAPTMDFFYGAECKYCHSEMKWFPELKEMYPDLEIRKYEVWHDVENKIRWEVRMRELGTKATNVPTNVIGNDLVIGFNAEGILAALEKNYGPPAVEKKNVPKGESDGWKKYLTYSWPAMSVVLGILDGFNPCAMWTLLILIGFLLAMEDKKKRWMVGGIFVASSAIIYFLALLAYLLGFAEVSSWVAGPIMTWVFRVVGVIAIGTGIMAFKESFKKEIDCDVRDMASKKRFRDRLSAILEKEKMIFVLAGVVGLAFSVNAIELLCSFAIPTAFTATIVSLKLSFASQISALVLYDLAYIFDDVLVLVIALWTMSLKILSPKLVQISHLIGGIVLLILGGFLLFDPSLLASLIG